MSEMMQSIGWAVIYAFVGGMVGLGMVAIAATVLPRLIEKFTPNLDEEKEIARGNVAVGEYFGRVVGASILGASIIVAAATAPGRGVEGPRRRTLPRGRRPASAARRIPRGSDARRCPRSR